MTYCSARLCRLRRLSSHSSPFVAFVAATRRHRHNCLLHVPPPPAQASPPGPGFFCGINFALHHIDLDIVSSSKSILHRIV